MAFVKHDRKRTEIRDTRSLFDYADDFALRVATSCGRSGACHECVVEILEGATALSPRSGFEGFLQDPFRLACQATVKDTGVDVAFAPLRREPKILETSKPF
ncbi:(2Fe-2S)-binding protein, partial [bacterium]|nr:(2Fe-2S)-binding protein [bacterium]